jgi:hypothetical protein
MKSIMRVLLSGILFGRVINMGFYIGIIAAVFAIVSIFFRRNTKGRSGNGTRRNNRLFFGIGIIAAIIGLIGYVFLGWRF